MPDVIGVGANSVDHVYRLPSYPQPHGPRSKLRITRHFLSPGGQTATALATCAALGLRAKYIGVLGADANGAALRAELERRGIDVTAVITRDLENPYAVILIDESTGERIVLWDRPGDLAVSEHECRDRLGPHLTPGVNLPRVRVVHVDDVDPRAALQAARLAREAGVLVTTDLERVTDQTEALVRTATHPILSEDLASALTGETDPERALARLEGWSDGPIIVTRGARGSMALADGRIVHAPGVTVKAVDTTGAGDVFRGACIRGLMDGLPLDALLRFANTAAAISCTREGAIRSVPTLEEVRGQLLMS